MAALRELLAVFGVEFDAKELQKGNTLVDQMADKLAGFGKLLVGAFAIDAIASFTGALFQEADALAKQAGALQISAAELQGWQHAASLSGSSAEEFTAALTKFTRNVQEAADGTTTAVDAFRKLGVEFKDAAGNARPPLEILDDVADALAGMQDPAKRTSAVMDLFGRSGARLLPLFDEGSEGIRKLRAEVRELGGEFDEAFLENAQEFNDNVARMKLGLKGLVIQGIGPLLPDLARLTQQAVAVTKTFVGWIKQSRIVQALLVGVSAKGVVGLFMLMKAIAPLRALLLRAFLPLLLLEDFLVFLAGGKSRIGKVIDAAFGKGSAGKVQSFVAEIKAGFEEMLGAAQNNAAEFDRTWAAALESIRNDARKTFGPTFGEVIVAAEDTFFAFVKALSGGFSGVGTFIMGVLHGIAFQFELVFDDLEYAVLISVATMQDAFARLWNAINRGGRATANFIQKLLGAIPGMGDAAQSVGDAIRTAFGADLEASNVNVVEAVARQRDKERFAEAEEISRMLGLNGAAAVASVTGPGARTLNQQNQVNVVQNITAGTPAEVAREARKGAVSGVTQGVDLRAVQDALFPTAG